MIRCPECKSKNVIPITYGLPTIGARREASQGKRYLAGCNWTRGMPNLHCKNCGHEFSEEKKVKVEKKRTRSEASRAAWATHRDKIIAGMKKAAEKRAEKIKS